MEIISKAGDALIAAAKSGVAIEPLRHEIGVTDIDQAYAIQEYVRAVRLKSGGKIVGKKIGLTSVAVQKQLGVDQPDFGMLCADTHIPNGGSVSYTDILQPKAEAELAFILKADVPLQPTMDDVIQAIDCVKASIEVVGSRIVNWDIRITDTVADNASASHFVLGDQKVNLDEVDLTGCGMKLYVNNELRSEGSGAACLGNPLNAVLWLANEMGRRNTPLQAGDIILSGALGPMVPIVAGDHILAKIDGFDDVTFSCV